MPFSAKSVSLACVVCSLLMTGCVSGNYRAPAATDAQKSVVVDKNFDETWDDLLSYTAGSFFGIENFEKESGLLTLSFGAGDASPYIDCGTFSFQRGVNSYNGPYVDYVDMRGADLTGKMNLRVRPIANQKSEVTVNARYVFSVPPMIQAGVPSFSFVFDSGGSDTVTVPNPTPGTHPTRTCVPTGYAEREILEAVKS